MLAFSNKETSDLEIAFSRADIEVSIRNLGHMLRINTYYGGDLDALTATKVLTDNGLVVLHFIDADKVYAIRPVVKPVATRNLTVTSAITEADSLSVITLAMVANPSLSDTQVGRYHVHFVTIPAKGYSIVSISTTKAHMNAIAFAFVDIPPSGSITAPEKKCPSCYGHGSVSTGIDECPTTICERCNGLGKVYV